MISRFFSIASLLWGQKVFQASARALGPRQQRDWRAGIMGILLLLSTIPWTASALPPIYRQGCEFPLKGVHVCWEATAEMNAPFAPFPELHLLPIARQGSIDPELLGDYTRTIYRQLVSGDLTKERLIQEWNPILNLDEAISLAHQKKWASMLWIAPRTLRIGSSATPGLVDWDLYLINGKTGRLIRTMRIRVESLPMEKSDEIGTSAASGAILGITGALRANPLASAATIAGSAAQTPHSPPTAGISLELMTELAVRQLLYISQYPLEELVTAPATDESSQNILQKLFSR